MRRVVGEKGWPHSLHAQDMRNYFLRVIPEVQPRWITSVRLLELHAIIVSKLLCML